MIKRFRPTMEGEHEREWRALTLLEEWAPGLAPTLMEADSSSTAPVVSMSRLPGTPLRGQTVTTKQLEALAAALTCMHEAVPRSVAARLPPRLWNEHQVVRGIRARYAQVHRGDVPAVIRRAAAEGFRWLNRTVLASARSPSGPVFGQADGNLANFLWDGSRIRIVDFEDSGRSDRAYELAEVVEHVSTWVDTDFAVPRFLDHFDLSRAERRRLLECRRLLALLWLLLLTLQEPQQVRNPPGTAELQAARLRGLLGG
ncbi:aminoglycoside phosphotransferase family protein [Kitasatospora sp. LaBMicrA B282]|uniref:aminoglycoside phosphotransferase family protein n=1 Tax=Kitasatospora sp. LaBMicrA B282 TaxID=3420949 RepID=UPI003D107CBD